MKMEVIQLHIKNMVCSRCILVVKNELTALGAEILQLTLGYATILAPNELSWKQIDKKLREFGLELLDDQELVIVEQIKINIRAYIKLLEESAEDIILSEFLSRQIGKNYNYLSKLFSKHESHTIEAYYIHQRIEKVKQLLDYDEMNLSQIAIKLGYSSVHYLSSQFKKVTGLSVSDYKAIEKNKNEKYGSLADALNDLKEKGYRYYFNTHEDCIECKELCTSFDLYELKITEAYRFEEICRASGSSVIYTIASDNGIKGILIESDSSRSNSLTRKLLARINDTND